MKNNKQKFKFIGIQGFGYVGAANAVNVALSTNFKNYKVICFEKKNTRTLKLFNKAKQGIFPYFTTDKKLIKKFKLLIRKKKIIFSFNKSDYEKTKIILVTINYDVKNFKISRKNFLKSFNEILNNIKKNTLIIIESTVPPGTCQKDLKPLIMRVRKKRKIKNIFLSHSFERVMPGNNYLDSCRNINRVYSGIDEKSKTLCKNFLRKTTNVKKYPLTELENTTASETCKIIENSFRSVNIIVSSLFSPSKLTSKGFVNNESTNSGDTFISKIFFIRCF